MDCSTGKIYSKENTEEFEKALKELGDRKPLPLTDKQYKELKPLSLNKRKKRMRNKPCTCGSGKKCCWNQYEPK